VNSRDTSLNSTWHLSPQNHVSQKTLSLFQNCQMCRFDPIIYKSDKIKAIPHHPSLRAKERHLLPREDVLSGRVSLLEGLNLAVLDDKLEDHVGEQLDTKLEALIREQLLLGLSGVH